MSEKMSDSEKVLCYEAHIADMLAAIQERMDELSDDAKSDDFEKGRKLAYFEVMDMIKTRHSIILEVIEE